VNSEDSGGDSSNDALDKGEVRISTAWKIDSSEIEEGPQDYYQRSRSEEKETKGFS
jgi:hypothetical protein